MSGIKRWPEPTYWKDSKTWKINFKILAKLFNFKKKKKVSRTPGKKNQTIYKGKRTRLPWGVSKATYKAEKYGAAFSRTQRKKLWTKDFTASQVSFNYQSYRKITCNIQSLRDSCTHESFLRNMPEDKLHSTKRWLKKFWQKDWWEAFNIFNCKSKTKTR